VYVRVVTKSPTSLDGAYGNALLLAHWSVCQKLNHVSSVQFGYSYFALYTPLQKQISSQITSRKNKSLNLQCSTQTHHRFYT